MGTEEEQHSVFGRTLTCTLFLDQLGMVGGHVSAYRWHINDPIVFNKSIRVSLEHFGWMSADEHPKHQVNSWNEHEDDYSSVAFWYQTGEPTFAERAPESRVLPSLERVTAYSRDVAKTAAHGPGDIETQQLDFYDGKQLLYMPKQQEGSYIEFPIEVTKKEPLRLVLNMTRSYDFGKYQASLNGVKLGRPIDLYSAEVSSDEVPLLDFWPEPGKYTLRLECVGKNPQSTGHYLGIESVRLRERRPRVAEFGFDKDKDWKTRPELYL